MITIHRKGRGGRGGGDAWQQQHAAVHLIQEQKIYQVEHCDITTCANYWGHPHQLDSIDTMTRPLGKKDVHSWYKWWCEKWGKLYQNVIMTVRKKNVCSASLICWITWLLSTNWNKLGGGGGMSTYIQVCHKKSDPVGIHPQYQLIMNILIDSFISALDHLYCNRDHTSSTS